MAKLRIGKRGEIYRTKLSFVVRNAGNLNLVALDDYGAIYK